MNQHVIIVAGGSGTRMNSAVPKQFLQLNGKAIIIRTIEKFFAFNPDIQIIVVVHQDYLDLFTMLLKTSSVKREKIKITKGGESRFESVKNGLTCLDSQNGIVGIHDAARPFVSIGTIASCYGVAELKGNAIPCIAIHESLRQINGDNNSVVNRDKFKIIQTPQCFEITLIKKAFEQAYRDSFTDDDTVVETGGIKINLVEGNIENIKITSPADLIIAKAFCEHE